MSFGSAGENGGVATARLLVTVTGTVQGVGYRPFVHQLASRLGLAGSVCNESGAVRIIAEGDTGALEGFLESLRRDAPPLARVENIRWNSTRAQGIRGFRIERSTGTTRAEARIPPDMAICKECLSELRDRRDRRHGYPFLNCVNCGPRLTIIEGVPYDRERTTLREFRLCRECESEFEDPADRRFHAQAVACPCCGPTLSLLSGAGSSIAASDPLGEAVRALARDQIVAIKGVGGYHLACDARSGEAVSELRRRKRREAKPLAIMAASLGAARELCEIGPEEAALLESPARPIVLLKARPGSGLAREIAFESPELGVMLPYAPLHHLIFDRLAEHGLRALVMTSGNEAEQPIVYDDAAVLRLKGLADLFLAHNRPIATRCDDSVARVMPGAGPQLIRRSRGYAPDTVRMPLELPFSVLAAGAQLKNTFALGTGTYARLSHHIGDLDDFAAIEAYVRDIAHYEALFGTRPRAIAHDLHPDYLSTRYARERAGREGLRLVPVQHHHAHLASCMAENGISHPVIGVIFDGTGYGTDGKTWGGEFLVGDFGDFERAAHLAYLPMPGGELAIREPWRMALAGLLHAGRDWEPLKSRVSESSLKATRRMIEKGLNCPLTSSMGRLFDAIAALLGLRMQVHYEAQAAMELEWLASSADAARDGDVCEFGIGGPVPDGGLVVDPAPVIAGVADRLRAGVPAATVARDFHRAVAGMVGRICRGIREKTGHSEVALSGGVYMNSLLLELSLKELKASGFRVHFHRLVPCNDGGISLGQLAVAAQALKRG